MPAVLGRRTQQGLQLAGYALVFVLLARVGWSPIAAALQHASVAGVVSVVTLGLIACLVRLEKLRLVLPSLGDSETRIQVFVLARVGREVSQVGHLSPLLLPGLRSGATLRGLMFDRYCEAFATITLALGASLFGSLGTLSWVRPALALALAALVVAVAFPLPSLGRLARLEAWRGQAEALRAELWRTLAARPRVVLLALVATATDFVGVAVTFAALGVHVDLWLVPVVWAASGLAALVTFMSLGPAEYSTVYLYSTLAGIGAPISVAMMVLMRASALVLLAALLGVRRLRRGLPAVPASPDVGR